MQTESHRRCFPYSLIVLAGGSSSRMGRDKALLPVGEGTLIEYIIQQMKSHFKDILISVSDPFKFEFLDQKTVVDENPGYGPLMGIKSALAVSRYEKNFVIACDIPQIPEELLVKILLKGQNFDIVVPVSPSGDAEPLFAVYSKSILPQMEQLIRNNMHSLLDLFGHCKTGYIKMETQNLLANLNTRKEYETFLRKPMLE